MKKYQKEHKASQFGLWNNPCLWEIGLRLTRVVSTCACAGAALAWGVEVTAVGARVGSGWISGLIQCGTCCISTLPYNCFHTDPFLCLEETQSRSPTTFELIVFQLNTSEKHPKSLAKVISYQVCSQICRLKRVHESQISSQPFAA